MNKVLIALIGCAALLAGCDAPGGTTTPGKAEVAPAASAAPFAITEIATFDSPWAMTFLPDGRLLVTEKPGRLRLVEPGGKIGNVSG
ncbi:MAG: PQQ-dependent sugar dehydrogenase, partial [Arenimonas sp.]|nr:PQQ-dependent sugar dehydrogenase [Arenimonas sp.]